MTVASSCDKTHSVKSFCTSCLVTSSFSTASLNLQYLDSLLGPVLTAKDTGLCPHTVVGSLSQSLVLYSFLPGGVEELPWTRDMKVTLVAQFCWEPLHSLSESTAEVKYTQYKRLRRFLFKLPRWPLGRSIFSHVLSSHPAVGSASRCRRYLIVLSSLLLTLLLVCSRPSQLSVLIFSLKLIFHICSPL